MEQAVIVEAHCYAGSFAFLRRPAMAKDDLGFERTPAMSARRRTTITLRDGT